MAVDRVGRRDSRGAPVNVGTHGMGNGEQVVGRATPSVADPCGVGHRLGIDGVASPDMGRRRDGRRARGTVIAPEPGTAR